MRRLLRKISRELRRIRDQILDAISPPPDPGPAPSPPDPVPPDPTPPETEEWHSGYTLRTNRAENGVVEFWTRNILAPTRPQPARGDYEYILALVQGEGFERLLIMSMYARQPRISMSGHRFRDGLFPQPLPGPSHWRVISDRATIRIELDGREIWRESGRYWITQAVMGGYHGRGFLGEYKIPKRG